MTNNYIAYLQWGSRRLNLDGTDGNGTATTGGIWLGPGFAPPPAQFSGGVDGVPLEMRSRTFNVPIHIRGGGTTSEPKIRRMFSQLQTFLALAQDPTHDLYFCYRAHALYPFEPLFGQQGAVIRYRVQSGRVEPNRGNYGLAQLARTGVPDNQMTLTIDPWALGAEQEAGTASGAVMMHDFATPDGMTRGLIVPIAGTNMLDNPMFGHPTWNTDWTDSANLTDIENTDKRFVIYGESSAELTASGDDGEYYQSISLEDTESYTFSCFIKLPDGGTVSSTQVEIYNSAAVAVTEAYYEAGDGWWIVTGTWTADATAATNVGITVKEGFTVYMDMAWMENLAYITPPFYGDMNGCSWSGTAHAASSTSARTVGALFYGATDLLKSGEGTIRAVVSPWVDDGFASNMNILFENGAYNLIYDVSNNRFAFTDGTNTAAGATRALTEFEVIIVHATYSPAGGLDLYVNGAVSGSGAAAYTPPTRAASAYIGSTATPNGHWMGTILGVTTFDRAMTSTQVANDYTHIAGLVNSGDGIGQRADWLPWAWTIGGDGVIDMYSDGSSTAHYTMIGDVCGDANADTIWKIDTNGEDLTASVFAHPNNWFPMVDMFSDLSGTVVAGALGGEVQRTSVGTTYTNVTSSGPVALTSGGYQTRSLTGHQYAIGAVLADADTGLIIKGNLTVSLVLELYTDENFATSADTTRRFYITNSSLIPHDSVFDHIELGSHSHDFDLYVKHTSGTDNVDVDFFMVYLGRIHLITSGGGTTDSYYIRGNTVQAITSAGLIYDWPAHRGDSLDLESNKYNYVVMTANDIAGAVTNTNTSTIVYLGIVPRWNLI